MRREKEGRTEKNRIKELTRRWQKEGEAKEK